MTINVKTTGAGKFASNSMFPCLFGLQCDFFRGFECFSVAGVLPLVGKAYRFIKMVKSIKIPSSL